MNRPESDSECGVPARAELQRPPVVLKLVLPEDAAAPGDAGPLRRCRVADPKWSHGLKNLEPENCCEIVSDFMLI